MSVLEETRLGRAILKYAKDRIEEPNLTDTMMAKLKAKPIESAKRIAWDAKYWEMVRELGLRVEKPYVLGVNRILDTPGNFVGYIMPTKSDLEGDEEDVVWTEIE
jgi:hypothetical protein